MYIREDHSSVPEMVFLGDVYSFFFDCACTYICCIRFSVINALANELTTT